MKPPSRHYKLGQVRPPSRHYKLAQIESTIIAAREALRKDITSPTTKLMLNTHQILLLMDTLRLGLSVLYRHPEILDTMEIP